MNYSNGTPPSVLLKLLLSQCLIAFCASQDFDFFYFVQQWPGSYCDTRRSCCYPTSGKPVADFGIHGLWPHYNDGSYPSNCDPDSSSHESQISDLLSNMRSSWATLSCPSNSGLNFWSHEWIKHGTCSESVLDQHSYFSSALSLKKQTNLLQALTSAGINPDGGSYRLESIKDAIKEGVGYTPFIECNVDTLRNRQLYQVYLCVDSSGSKLIECPVLRSGRCGSHVKFPTF